MKRLAISTLALAVGIGAPGASLGTARQADGGMIAVAVSVAASDGRRVRGLTADQFDVRIDDRPVFVVESIEGPDLAVSLLIDASGSMPGLVAGALRELIRTVPTALRPRDVAGINWFGKSIVIGPTFGRDRSIFDQAARDLERDRREPFSPSPLWDAMNASLTTLERQPQRRALIVWSDGKATGNLVPFDVVMRHALGAGVTTSFIIPGMPSPTVGLDLLKARPSGRGRAQPLLPDDYVMPWERPRLVAEATGGLAGGLGSPREEPGKHLRRLIEGLQADYLLRVRLETPDGRLHPIDIRVKAPELSVRAPGSVLAR